METPFEGFRRRESPGRMAGGGWKYPCAGLKTPIELETPRQVAGNALAVAVQIDIKFILTDFFFLVNLRALRG